MGFFSWTVGGVKPWPLIVAFFLVFCTSIFLRVLYIHPSRRPPHPPRSKDDPSHLLIVLGSGGHTAEMLSMIRRMDPKRYTYRTYIVSTGDDFSAIKAQEFEDGLRQAATTEFSLNCIGDLYSKDYRVVVVPRARRVHQRLLTTPITCIVSFFTIVFHLLGATPVCPLDGQKSKPASKPKARKKHEPFKPCPAVYQHSYNQTVPIPDLVLTNGPATGLIVVIAAYLLRFFGVPETKDKLHTIYVESFARVSSLSLSGKILAKFGLCDRFIVQWEKGRETARNAEWRGFLVE